MFEQYIPLSEEQIKNIWDDSIIVPDTNVLLHLYRYDITLRNKLLGILKNDKINDCLWVPAKVYEEFLKNRPAVICEQLTGESKIEKILQETKNFFLHKIDTDFLLNHCPYIPTSKIKECFNEFIESQLKAIQTEHEANYAIELNNDPLLDEMLKLLNGKVGTSFSDSEMEKIIEEGKKRYEEKIPPGYKDAKKEGNEKYSDFIIWKQILNYAQENKVNMIFITDDKKEDWWRVEHGMTVGPQPQLLEEFYNFTGKKILLYKCEPFFSYVDNFIESKKQLTKQDKESIDRVTYYYENPTFNIRANPKRIVFPKYTVDEIVDWFFGHYKDPAEGVPYDGREGGYLYINGGPYEAEDILIGAFPNIDEETLSKALSIIEPFGFEWVKHDQY
jgi:rRNA-processing protein FCF1